MIWYTHTWMESHTWHLVLQLPYEDVFIKVSRLKGFLQVVQFLQIEHLGRLPAQRCENANEAVTSFMRPPPVLNEDEFSEPALADDMVEDPLAEKTINLWNETATNNRNIFTEVFRPVPSNLVESWAAYEKYLVYHL